MPLDSRKASHIQANIAKTFTGRTQQVVLTLRQAGGGTTTLTVNAIWRVLGDVNPLRQGATNALTHLGVEAPIIACFNAADVTLPQLRACIYAQLGTGAIGDQPAVRYVPTTIETVGILPGGTRHFVSFASQS